MSKQADGAFIYADDFLGGVTHLSAEEVGAYWLLLLEQMKRGSLPTEFARLARIAHLSSALEMEAMWGVIGEKFTKGEDGRLFNERLASEMQQRADFRERKRAAGKLGADKRWQNDSTTNGTANGTPNGKPDGTTNGKRIAAPRSTLHAQEPTTQAQENSCSPKAASEYTQDFLAWWKPYPRKVGKRKAAAAYARAKKRASVAELLEGSEAMSAAWPPGSDLQFCPHAETWLNQDRWTDDRSQWGPPKGSDTGKDYSAETSRNGL